MTLEDRVLNWGIGCFMVVFFGLMVYGAGQKVRQWDEQQRLRAYKVVIANACGGERIIYAKGYAAPTLFSRHWVIVDLKGTKYVVEGQVTVSEIPRSRAEQMAQAAE